MSRTASKHPLGTPKRGVADRSDRNKRRGGVCAKPAVCKMYGVVPEIRGDVDAATDDEVEDQNTINGTIWDAIGGAVAKERFVTECC